MLFLGAIALLARVWPGVFTVTVSSYLHTPVVGSQGAHYGLTSFAVIINALRLVGVWFHTRAYGVYNASLMDCGVVEG